MVAFIHDQNISCSKTCLDVTKHEQTAICRQLFAGHVVGLKAAYEKEEKMHSLEDNALCWSSSFVFQP